MKSRNIQSILIAGNRPLQKRLNVFLALSVLSLIVAISSATAFATTLNGAGQLLLPPNCPGSDCGNQLTGLFPNITQSNNAFTGVFPGNADPAYGGQFNGTGPYPTYAGSSHFDFTGLNAGSLPAGTFVWFGDLDRWIRLGKLYAAGIRIERSAEQRLVGVGVLRLRNQPGRFGSGIHA